MVRHSQRRQRCFFTILSDPVHIGLKATNNHVTRMESVFSPLRKVHIGLNFELSCCGKVSASCSVIALVPSYLLILFIAFDLWLHGKNVFMWGSNQKLTRPLIATCCPARPHWKPNDIVFPIQKIQDDQWKLPQLGWWMSDLINGRILSRFYQHT